LRFGEALVVQQKLEKLEEEEKFKWEENYRKKVSVKLD
jgi:hypothetical protein